jgi:hypothetical protein
VAHAGAAADAASDLHQPFGLQDPQRLPHDRLRAAELGGELLLDRQSLARRQQPVRDATSELGGDGDRGLHGAASSQDLRSDGKTLTIFDVSFTRGALA